MKMEVTARQKSVLRRRPLEKAHSGPEAGLHERDEWQGGHVYSARASRRLHVYSARASRLLHVYSARASRLLHVYSARASRLLHVEQA